MKKSNIVFIISLFVVLLSSCKKDDTTSTTSLVGTWKKPYQSYTVGITFKSDNTFSFGIYNGSSYAETIAGSYSASGNIVTFSNQSGSMEACPNTAATYNYNISGSSVTLAVNNDPCTGRPSKIEGTWTK